MSDTTSEILHKIKAVTKQPYLIGMDGRSGAGKSTLSDRLQAQLPGMEVVHKDDFYRVMDEDVRATLDAEQGYDRYFDWERLEQQVLQPLSAGKTAYYQRYDWGQKDLSETITVSPEKIILVEGIYSTRPELIHYYDLCIWVETSHSERLHRQIARKENSRNWIQRWADAETFYVTNFRSCLSDYTIVSGE